METEAHVYALAVAASTLLAFYPFLIVMLSFCRDILHWPAALQAIYLALGDFFAGEPGAFLVRNLQPYLVPKLHITSMFLLLFTANGIFEPLEVALNRAWGVAQNRSYTEEPAHQPGPDFACGGLALLSLMLTALNSRGYPACPAATRGRRVDQPFDLQAGGLAGFDPGPVPGLLAAAQPQDRAAARGSGGHRGGPGFEALKYVNLLLSPMLTEKLKNEYDIFRFSVTILLRSFAAAHDRAGGRALDRAPGSRTRSVIVKGRRPYEGLESHRQGCRIPDLPRRKWSA